jgi:hypothetical protein
MRPSRTSLQRIMEKKTGAQATGHRIGWAMRTIVFPRTRRFDPVQAAQ